MAGRGYRGDTYNSRPDPIFLVTPFLLVFPPCNANNVIYLPDIEAAVFGFLDGYWQAGGHGKLTVAVGTNNFCMPDPTSGLCRLNNVTTAHGQAWGKMIADINAYISSTPSYADRLSVVGASDIEPLYSPYTVAQAWIDGYASTSPVNYINYGSADQCSTTGNPNQLCANNWTSNNIWSITWGNNRSAPPVPQIYAVRGGNAKQWAMIANLGGTLRPIQAALTQWQACVDKNGADCQGTNNTPLQAWQQLMDAIYNANAAMAPTVQPALYSSDITWQN
jgi:hypothetical protein